MNEPIRNWNPPSTDGRLALENRDLYVAQSAATKDGKVAPLPMLEQRRFDDAFASVFGGAR
jgi:hypothetical protein